MALRLGPKAQGLLGLGLALLAAILGLRMAPGQGSASVSGQVPPTPPFPTLAPTDPFPTLPPSVPTPSLFTPTPTRAIGASATVTASREPSPTQTVALPSASPSPPFDLRVPLLLPFLAKNHLALDPQQH